MVERIMASNSLIFVFSLPDTFIAQMGGFATPTSGIGAALYNRFEDAVSDSVPVIALLRAVGAEGARMTGSGTAVFGLFSDPDRAAYACRILQAAGVGARTAVPV